MTAPLFSVPQGEFELQRNPPDDNLLAWNAADEFILTRLHEIGVLGRDSHILLLNDRFGALAVALADHNPYSWCDSYLSQQALSANLTLNGLEQDQVAINADHRFPQQCFDCVIMKLPKSNAMLEHQLYQLRDLVDDETFILAGGMTKEVRTNTLNLFEQIIGPVETTRAFKKSRLIMAERDLSLCDGESPYPDFYELEVDRLYRITNHAGVFSREHLDQGSRLLIEWMPQSDSYRDIVDLGCGNGVLGIVAASLNPQSSLVFSDESYMAIASASDNFRGAFGSHRQASFLVDDCLSRLQDNSQDLVLNNPPFHQQHNVGDAIAWHMFLDARRVLRPGGELWLVANRHLGYHAKLKKIFGSCETVGGNSKFVVLKARKS